MFRDILVAVDGSAHAERALELTRSTCASLSRVTFCMDVPGLRAENIQIELENDVLTVSGERPFPYAREDDTGPARRVQRGFGRFQRSLRVPPGLDPDAIEASISDGVLRPRGIEISADADGPGQEAGTTAQVLRRRSRRPAPPSAVGLVLGITNRDT